MKLALIILVIISVIELLLGLPVVWLVRKVLASLVIILLGICSFSLLVSHFSGWTLLLTLLSSYRIVSLLRVIKDRSHVKYLFHAIRRSSCWLVGLQILVLAAAWLQHIYSPSPMVYWYTVTILQILAAIILLASTIRHRRTTKLPALTAGFASRDLPSLSVAIPARNETDALEACLQSLINSDYLKLEILVLDDCSQNKRTSEIIRDFAHHGVRFIAGKVPPENWLAKNYAYKQLFDEANSELLVFCGVDARFEPHSLRIIVETMLQKEKQMISIMPRNTVPPLSKLEASFVQPSRYAWELALPRRLLERPPVLSTYWAISREALEAAGGFEAVTRSSQPERYLARHCAANQDSYSFMRSDSSLGLLCNKSFEEQQATAIRTRYPQLHGRPELVAVVSVAEILILAGPICLFLSALVSQWWQLTVLFGIATVLVIAMYVIITNFTYHKFLWRSLWLLPLAALYDVGLLNYSMYQYEFREVIWKGRNVCIPVMQVITKLPGLS